MLCFFTSIFFWVGVVFKTSNPQKKIMGFKIMLSNPQTKIMGCFFSPDFSFSFTIFWSLRNVGFNARPSQLPFLGPPNWQRCVAARWAGVKAPFALVEIGTQRGQVVDEESWWWWKLTVSHSSSVEQEWIHETGYNNQENYSYHKGW